MAIALQNRSVTSRKWLFAMIGVIFSAYFRSVGVPLRFKTCMQGGQGSMTAASSN